jgi:hypothetical protein
VMVVHGDSLVDSTGSYPTLVLTTRKLKVD